MADIPDEKLKEEIEKILKGADLAVWTTKKVIQQLEKTHGSKIRKRKAVIDAMVLDYVNQMESEKEESESSEEEDEKKDKIKPEPKMQSEGEENESSEEEKEDEIKPEPKTNRGRRAAPKPRVTKEKVAKPKKAAKKGGGGGTGFTRSYKLSPELAALMGSDELPRHAVVKRIWAIVKENNLYDPNNKQFAICDDALYKVIGKQRFKVFGMMKHLKGHFLG